MRFFGLPPQFGLCLKNIHLDVPQLYCLNQPLKVIYDRSGSLQIEVKIEFYPFLERATKCFPNAKSQHKGSTKSICKLSGHVKYTYGTL